MKKKLVKPKYNKTWEKTSEIKSFQKSTFDETNMLPDKETTNTVEDMREDQHDDGQLHNASAESDPLDSEQKAASEADTLPIEKKVEGLEVAKSERYMHSKKSFCK